MAENNQKDPLKLIDLNTDCIIQICKYLNREDLCHFKMAHSHFDDAVDYIICANDTELPVIHKETLVHTLKFIKKYLQLFGDKIKNLKIPMRAKGLPHGKTINDVLELLITKYCSAGNIKHCAFRGFQPSKRFFETNSNFLSGIHILKLGFKQDGSLDWLIDSLLTSQKLLNLSLYACGTLDELNLFSKIAASQLESFQCELTKSNSKRKHHDISKIPINHTLVHLAIWEFDMNPAYLSCFPKLESLEIEADRETSHMLEPILNLAALKKLWFVFQVRDVAPIAAFLSKLSDQNKLTTLTIYCDDDANDDDENFIFNDDDANDDGNANDQDDNGDDDNAMDTDNSDEEEIVYNPNPYEATEIKLASILCKMTNLTELEVYIMPTFYQQLPLLGHRLKNLRTFSFSHSHSRKIISAEKLLDFLKKARKLITLEVGHTLNNFQQFYDDSVKIRQNQANEEILYVKTNNSNDEAIHVTSEQKKYVILNEHDDLQHTCRAT